MIWLQAIIISFNVNHVDGTSLQRDSANVTNQKTIWYRIWNKLFLQCKGNEIAIYCKFTFTPTVHLRKVWISSLSLAPKNKCRCKFQEISMPSYRDGHTDFPEFAVKMERILYFCFVDNNEYHCIKYFGIYIFSVLMKGEKWEDLLAISLFFLF